MTIIMAMPADAVTHPDWCSAPHCLADPQLVDVRHSSVPLTVRATQDDVLVTTALHRDDELTRDGRVLPGPFGIKLQLRNTESVQLNGAPIEADVLLTPEEATRLAVDLLAYAANASREQLAR